MTDNAFRPDPDPFELFGLTPTFRLDASEVRRRRVRALASRGLEAEEVTADSERLNAAQASLLDPYARAGILLVRLRAPAVDARLLPEGFLLEMMELREAVDGGDAATRAELRRMAADRRREALEVAAGAFESALASGGASVSEAEAIQRSLNAARSFDRMIEQLDREGDGA
jgi:hypothetical protein